MRAAGTSELRVTPFHQLDGDGDGKSLQKMDDLGVTPTSRNLHSMISITFDICSTAQGGGGSFNDRKPIIELL